MLWQILNCGVILAKFGGKYVQGSILVWSILHTQTYMLAGPFRKHARELTALGGLEYLGMDFRRLLLVYYLDMIDMIVGMIDLTVDMIVSWYGLSILVDLGVSWRRRQAALPHCLAPVRRLW